MRKKIHPILSIFIVIFFLACGSDKLEIEYIVNSDRNIFPAKIKYFDSNQNEQTLVDISLPWTYAFKAKEGDKLKLSADLYITGNIAYIGVDTMRLKILLNGSVLKEATDIIINRSMEEVTIEGTVPD